MENTIAEFRGKYFFLNNFYSAPVIYLGQSFKNNEAAFQSAKCPERSCEFQDLNPSYDRKQSKEKRKIKYA